MARKFTDPTYYIQAEDRGDNPLHKNLYRNNKTKVKGDEVKAVADLLYSLTHNNVAFAIAANQRGWYEPIFTARWELETLNLLPAAADLDTKHHTLLKDAISPTVYRNPEYRVLDTSEDYYTAETCLSWEGETALMHRHNTIEVSVDVLDMVARRGDRNRNHWVRKTFTLTGLASQIFQHETDHILGLGIWNMREI